MADDVQPPELARLLDFAERPRVADWSLRAALTRYGQPQPQRASDVTVLLRRIDFALKQHAATFHRDGPALWSALESRSGSGSDADEAIVGLLQAASTLDRLGDALAAWAVDRGGERPDAHVDAVAVELSKRLDALGVPREEGPPRPGGDGRGRRRG